MTDTILWELCGEKYEVKRSDRGEMLVRLKDGTGHVETYGPAMLSVHLEGEEPPNYLRGIQRTCPHAKRITSNAGVELIVCQNRYYEMFMEAVGATRLADEVVPAPAPEPAPEPEPVVVPEPEPEPAPEAPVELVQEPVVDSEPEPDPEPAPKPPAAKRRGRPRKVKVVEPVDGEEAAT